MKIIFAFVFETIELVYRGLCIGFGAVLAVVAAAGYFGFYF